MSGRVSLTVDFSASCLAFSAFLRFLLRPLRPLAGCASCDVLLLGVSQPVVSELERVSRTDALVSMDALDRVSRTGCDSPAAASVSDGRAELQVVSDEGVVESVNTEPVHELEAFSPDCSSVGADASWNLAWEVSLQHDESTVVVDASLWVWDASLEDGLEEAVSDSCDWHVVSDEIPQAGNTHKPLC